MTLDDILVELKNAKTIVILTHESPDGDAISSSLSVMHALAQFGKNADVVIPEHAKDFDFLFLELLYKPFLIIDFQILDLKEAIFQH